MAASARRSAVADQTPDPTPPAASLAGLIDLLGLIGLLRSTGRAASGGGRHDHAVLVHAEGLGRSPGRARR